MTTSSEADIEQIALNHLSDLGWQTGYGPDIDRDYSQVVFEERPRDALAQLNPKLPGDALDSAFRKLTQPEGSSLETRNRAYHRMLIWGVEVAYREGDHIRGAHVQAIGFDDPAANDWLAVNQFTVTERDHFQGKEAQIVVDSVTTSTPAEAPRGMEFLFSLRRLNVATSRAQSMCLLVGSPALFSPEWGTERQMRLANSFCRYLELALDIEL